MDEIKKNETYADQISEKINDFSNRRYQYEPSSNNLYQNYKKEYMTEAQKARTGVVNQGLQFSGGSGNNFSKSVGDQQYQTYLMNINRLAPAFENLEYAKYQGENDDLTNQLKLLLGQDNSQYGRGRDMLADERAYRDYLLGNNQFNTKLDLNLLNLANNKDSADKAYEMAKYKQGLNDYIAAQQAARAAASRSGRGGGGGGYDYYPEEPASNQLQIGYNVGTDYLYNGNSAANFTGVKQMNKVIGSDDPSRPDTVAGMKAVLLNKGYTETQANRIIAQTKRNYRQN